MTDDYYDDGDGNGDTMTEQAPAEEKEEQMEPQSGLVSRSFFAGKDNLKVGGIEKVKILRLMDDEVEIECVKEGYKEKEPKAEPMSEDDMMS